MKVKGLSGSSGGPTLMFVFWCPGCKEPHPYRVARGGTEGPEFPVWNFNGDREKPSFTPSLLCSKDTPEKRCHLFLTDGMIQFCSDCHHELAGQTVPCPDWDDERW